MLNRLPLGPRWTGGDGRALRGLRLISWLTSPLLIALLALNYVLTPAAAQTSCPTPSFQGLGPMPGDNGGGTFANGVSGDGSTMVGYTWVGSSATVPFR